MPPLIRVAIALSAVAYLLTLACLVRTTAISMTLFFAVGLPLHAAAALLYLIEVRRDLRRHDVF